MRDALWARRLSKRETCFLSKGGSTQRRGKRSSVEARRGHGCRRWCRAQNAPFMERARTGEVKARPTKPSATPVRREGPLRGVTTPSTIAPLIDENPCQRRGVELASSEVLPTGSSSVGLPSCFRAVLVARAKNDPEATRYPETLRAAAWIFFSRRLAEPNVVDASMWASLARASTARCFWHRTSPGHILTMIFQRHAAICWNRCLSKNASGRHDPSLYLRSKLFRRAKFRRIHRRAASRPCRLSLSASRSPASIPMCGRAWRAPCGLPR